MSKSKAKSASKSQGADGSFCTVSMTGFGRSSREVDGVLVEIEVKTVNSRFLDFNIKLPRAYNFFEPKIREIVAEYCTRGRVEVYVSRGFAEEQAGQVVFHPEVLNQYVSQVESVANERGIVDTNWTAGMVRDFLLRREVLDLSDEVQDEEKEQQVVEEVLREALGAVKVMREREGQKLGEDLVARLTALGDLKASLVDEVRKRESEVRTKYEERLQRILQETQLDSDRVATELAVLFDRLDVTEELVRLESHVEQFRTIMETTPNGRKLDFMLQEIGRELNTISSKAQAASLQRMAVEGKSEIERMKEQVQNLE